MMRALDTLCLAVAGGALGTLAAILIGALPIMVQPSNSAAVGQEQTP